jgi:hypothetical protein
MTTTSPMGLEVETTKAKVWRKYNDTMSGSVDIDMPCYDIEKTRQLLYEYAAKGFVEKLDDAFLEKAISVMDIGDDKVNSVVNDIPHE